MAFLVILVLTLLGLLALAFYRAPLWAWTLGVALGLLALSAAGGPFSWLVRLLWLPWLALALANLPAMRRTVLIKPLLAFYQRQLPSMSSTEREALEAGTVWWDAELFSGRPDWKRLLDLPAPKLSPEEQTFLDGPVEELCRMLNDWEISSRRDLSVEVWAFIKQRGFLGMIIPKEYGGMGFSAQAHSAVVSKISSRSPNAAVTVMVPNSLGPAELLLHYGTESQKDHYLPRLADGREIPCFALTSPYAGSDASSIPDHGVVCYGEYQGKNVIGIRVTWEKRYITLAPVATVLGLAFQLHDPEHLLGDKSISASPWRLSRLIIQACKLAAATSPRIRPFSMGRPRARTCSFPWTGSSADRRGRGRDGGC